MTAFNSRTSWKVEFVEIEKLRANLSKIPDQSEKIINHQLRTKSSPDTVKTIVEGMPVSKVKRRVTMRKNAKFSNPLTITHENMGFKIRPKKAFEYLKYPDLGIGTSVGKTPQEFMRLGMEKEIPKITNDLNASILEAINKNIGGK